MVIQYTFTTHQLNPENVQKLFQLAGCESANYPEKLHQALLNSHSVISAWDKGRLVGLANALSDGALTAYFHYVLIDPAYQGQGIGSRLMEQLLAKYENYFTKVLIAYPDSVDFYKALGFEAESDSDAMYLYKR